MIEVNPHSRNLKFISSIYILFWLLDLKKVDDSVSVYFSSFVIGYYEPIKYLSLIFITYFYWRFSLSVKSSFFSKVVEVSDIQLSDDMVDNNRLGLRRLTEDINKQISNSSCLHGKDSIKYKEFMSYINNPENIIDIKISPYHISRESKDLLRCVFDVNLAISQINGGIVHKDYISLFLDLDANNYKRFRLNKFFRVLFFNEYSPEYILPFGLFIAGFTAIVLKLFNVTPV